MFCHLQRIVLTNSRLRVDVLKSVKLISSGFRVNTCRSMSLLLNKTLVNGHWISASNNEQLAVVNPVNGEVVGHVPDLNVADAERALKAANDAFYSDEWRGLTAKDRSGLLKVRQSLVDMRTNGFINQFHPKLEMVAIAGSESKGNS